ncbi:MAG: OmpA-OmpF porin, family [Betaproteobacteria bacterium]|jgi:opacity protein-like surface antigen|nr:OmpA-OmpF porin, family [Betaproteobacteria bacterium]
MRCRKLWKTFALAAGFAVILPAAAQSTREDDAPHFYGGGSIGRNDHSEAAWSLFGGYQGNRWLGAEFGYQDLGRMTSGGVTVDASAWELVGVGRLPLFDRLAAYGKFGGYMGRSHGSGYNENNKDFTYGLGLEYSVTRNLAVRGEWQQYSDLGGGSLARSDLDVARVAVLYRFR